MKKLMYVLMAILILSMLPLSTLAIEYPNDMFWWLDEDKEIFYDVTNDKWYAEYVNDSYRRALFDGSYPNEYVHVFLPDDLLTREQVIVVLNRMAEGWNHHKETPVSNATGFVDVSKNEWYSYSVCWAKEKGITTGIADGVFGTGKNITREELATLAARYVDLMGLSLAPTENAVSSFADGDDVSAWAVDSVELMRESGVLQGDENHNFRPKDVITRAEAAAMIIRLEDSLVYESFDLFDFGDDDVASICFSLVGNSVTNRILITDRDEINDILEMLRDINISGSKSKSGMNGGLHKSIVILDENNERLFGALFMPDGVYVNDNRSYYFDAPYLQTYYDMLTE